MPLSKQDLDGIELAMLKAMNVHVKEVHSKHEAEIKALSAMASEFDGGLKMVKWIVGITGGTALVGGLAGAWRIFFLARP